MASFTLNVQLSNGSVTSDHVGEKLTIYVGDSLTVARSTGWKNTDSITEIVFYDKTNSQTPNYASITAASPSVASWAPSGTTNLTNHFTTSSVSSNGAVTSVTLTDAQTANSVDWFYVVNIGGKLLDPEVII